MIRAGWPVPAGRGGVVRSVRSAETTVATLLFVLALGGCAGPDERPAERATGTFPAEPTAESFRGMSYPASEAPLPRPGAGGPVWLIGIDGATWDLIEPRLERLPNFAALIEQGTHGVLLSEQPTISPAVWATIATGQPRFRHGVVNFVTRRPGTYDTVEVGPPDRSSPALWELVGSAGGTSAVVSWFGSFPAEAIAGSYVSKRFDPENLEPGQVYPPELGERLARESRVSMRRGDLERIGWTPDLREALLHDARTMAALEVICRDGSPDFVAAYLAGIDIAQHLTWRHMDPDSQAFPDDGGPDADLAGVIPAYYEFVDYLLGRVRELAPPDTTFVIVSDHGAGPMRADEAVLLPLPTFLETVGIQRPVGGEAFAISELYRHQKRIWLNLEGVEPAGVLPLADARVDAVELRDRLARMRTEDGDPVFGSLELHTEDPAWQPGDPALTVRFSYAARDAERIDDGGRWIDMAPIRLRLPDVSGAHRPEGIAIIAGAAIDRGRLHKPMSLYHVAPTVLHLLGLPQDGRMLRFAPADGGVLAAVAGNTPITMVAEYPGTDRSELLRTAQAAPVDPAHDQAIERLRSLGYIR
jgi:predicted AlkP superfamily phosphohydrolase/phosphomutase